MHLYFSAFSPSLRMKSDISSLLKNVKYSAQSYTLIKHEIEDGPERLILCVHVLLHTQIYVIYMWVCIKWKHFLIFHKSTFSIIFPNLPVWFYHLICLNVTAGHIQQFILM